MHGTMVKAAQRDEIGGLRFTAVGPVLDVMRVEVTRIRAAGETASFVAGVQHASQRSGNRARLASDVEWLAVIVLDLLFR